MFGFYGWFIIISIVCFAAMIVKSVRAEVNEDKTLKDYKEISVNEVPEAIQFLADRNKYDPIQFDIPDDINEPVSPKPYIPKKVVDGKTVYNFTGPMYVRQLQTIGDYAVKHDGDGGMIFYIKRNV